MFVNLIHYQTFQGFGGVRMTHARAVEIRLFENKIAVVTGGVQGIGAAIVDALFREGAVVYILDRMQVETESDRVISIQCDIASEDSVKAAFAVVSANSPKIDIVCANAGTVPGWATTQNNELETWNSVFAVNSTGVMLTIKHSASLFREGSGAIVVTGSMNSWKGDPNIAAYVASKHAALGIIKSTAIDLGTRGIRVNGVGPGPIATAALVERISDREGTTGMTVSETLEKLAQTTALNRLATVEDVVNTIIFLASEASAGISGQLIAVDCGVL